MLKADYCTRLVTRSLQSEADGHKLEFHAVSQVWRILFQRLQTARTKKYTAGLLTFLAWLICKQGAPAVQSSVDRVQPGLFRMLLDHVWFPSMSSIKAHDQEKLLFIATTQVGCKHKCLMNSDLPTALGSSGSCGLDFDEQKSCLACEVYDDKCCLSGVMRSTRHADTGQCNFVGAAAAKPPSPNGK